MLFFVICSISERLLGSEGISIFRRGRRKYKHDPSFVMLVYIYVLEGGPLEFAGKTRINLNEELIENGLAFPCPVLPQPAPPLPQIREWKTVDQSGISVNKMFWGSVTWVDLRGGIYLHDIKASPKLKEMTRWITDKYSTTKPSEADLCCRPGDLCIAKYEK